MSRSFYARGVAFPLAAVALAVAFAAADAGARSARATPPVGPCDPSITSCLSTFAFGSTRDHVKFLDAGNGTWTPWLDPPDLAAAILTFRRPLLGSEIYLTNPDLSNPRRLTSNTAFDGFPAVSPDGKHIVFDSSRLTGCGTCQYPWTLNRSDLFVMDTDGTEQTFLTHGSSATWSPDSKNIAFHASASGSGTPIRTDPGSATTDSDIFVANVDDLLAGVAQPRNLTNSPGIVDDDPDWSPDGQTIAYTRHDAGDDQVLSNTAEIYLIAADGSGTPQRLTYNAEEERGPSWSPDGKKLVYACRWGADHAPFLPNATFEICVIDVASGQVQRLTDNSVPDLTPTWSPDGSQILFHRRVDVKMSDGTSTQTQQLFVMNADGSDQTQLTFPGDGWNNLASWGEIRLHGSHANP